MKYLKFYLKLFLSFGIPFSIILGIAKYIETVAFNWQYMLFMGIGFGLLMSLFLGTFHITMVEDELKKGNYTVLNLHSQNKIIECHLSIEEIYELLKEKYDFKHIILNKNENIIKAKIGMSMQSWGEKMGISKLANSQTEYQIKSTPLLFSTLVDFGKNIKNINQVIEIIQDGK